MAEPNKSTNQGWWHTIPGILTAVATVITAVAGLIVGLHQAGLLSGDTNVEPRSSVTIAPPTETTETFPVIPPLPPPGAQASVFQLLAPTAGGLYYDFDPEQPRTVTMLDPKVDFHIMVESKGNAGISQIRISPFNGAAVYVREPVSVPWRTERTGYRTSGAVVLDKSGKWGCLTSEGRFCRLWAAPKGNDLVVVAEVYPKP